MRHEGAVDLSAAALAWAAGADRWRGCQAADMAATRFRDLDVRVGEHLLYLHRGSCEHRLIIEQVRAVHPTDPASTLAYPRLQFQKKEPVAKTCEVCTIFDATCVVHDDVLADTSPCHMCSDCFRALHYATDDSGVAKLIREDFRVYDYAP
jgi:hypothetical protein